jgi:hypothetical protein
MRALKEDPVNNQAVSSFQPRGIVRMRMGKSRVMEGVFKPRPSHDLVFRGGRTIAHLKYKNLYVGKGWLAGELSKSRKKLDAALAAAMTDAGLNQVVQQYFPSVQVTTDAMPSAVLQVAVQKLYDAGDIQALVSKVFMSGALASLDLDNFVMNFVLPPGAVLSDRGGQRKSPATAHREVPGMPEDEKADSKHGLGGYHGSIHVAHPAKTRTLYYSVAVWSEGQNGIAVPGWESWENACATLYHELNEARTDPDVDDAIATGDVRWVGWNSHSGEEIGDFPIDEAGDDLKLVFKKVPVAGGAGAVPIQLLWSNRAHGPELPAAGASAAFASLDVIALDDSEASQENVVG